MNSSTVDENVDLRVLLLAGRFQVRGTSNYTIRLAERLFDHRIGSLVVCPDATLIPAARRASIAVEEYHFLDLPLIGSLILESLRRDLSHDPPDIVHAQSMDMLRTGLWLAEHWERPLVLTVHDTATARDRSRLSSPLLKRIIAVSQSVKSELLARLGLRGDRIEVIHSGVESSPEICPIPVLDGTHVPVVGTAGPLEAVKGLPYFLGAARRVLSSGRDVEFLISGAGPEEENLRRMATELKISNHVTFAPNLPDFRQPLAAMDVFCLPSLRQGLGSIMLEAMVLGRPVIATSVGGVYSIVRDGQTGLVVPPSDSARLAERIIELLDDPARARELAETGRRTVQEQFGVEEMVARTGAVYRAVLAETSAPVHRAEAVLN
ncbi:MAG: glycosyltransferase family 4 protein [Planctomycetaceae bacterium]|nr:glycosyltransferase family 4 protein [Planctomycetaceae bacterium]